ncbi:M23 family metallopeptidase [Streptomyces jeddahensis]|uniref:Glycyl-glycine endopeptidase ALE-1 n=1 Tax=Streptomyces jeddahensis TaxID=1716141 RepID=A0A177HK92_9ACTN|nr:M23 family metallopeptidase [Streptomyces jeddahensis]OAH10654.1 glycyl-glycine endopeptidase ALE-1 precursor [Streptomyces jeddahensis]
MAFTRATGKHRRPRVPQRRKSLGGTPITRRTASAAGIAALTASGVMGTLASPAMAAGTTAEQTGLTQAVTLGESIADKIDAQAAAQQQAAEEAAAKKKAAELKRKAEAKAMKEREAKERAAREAERRRLLAYKLPITGSYVSTGYQSGGSLWSSGSHTGVDFHAASGTPVHSVGSGTVVTAGWGGAYGNQVVVRMNDGTYTQYGHLSSIAVSVGQKVTPGQQIALSGATGNVTGAHLHFEVRTTAEYGSDIDPLAYLRSHGVKI